MTQRVGTILGGRQKATVVSDGILRDGRTMSEAVITYFQRHRVGRLLKNGSATLLCATERVAGLPEVWQERPAILLNVGNDIKPAMNVELDEEFLACTVHFGGVPHEVEIHWSAVVRSEQLGRPTNGGTPAPAKAVA